MPTWLVITVTAVASYLLSLVVRVLTSREKKIDYKIAHLFSVGDEQFLRSMENLLPPAALGGNKITAYRNGDTFFPASAAFRGKSLRRMATVQSPMPL